MVIERLERHNLKLKPSKCQLFRKKVRYLGHVVSSEGISPDPEKIRAVKDWPLPRNEKELRGFLGLTGYYRRFVPGYAKISAPLHALVGSTQVGKKKKVKGTTLPGRTPTFYEKWESGHEEAFCSLKEKLLSSPILGYPVFTEPFILETDASFHGSVQCCHRNKVTK
ncbi:Transposon Ty3-I Gag-Pol polyprotein [Apostichopus japonicus]|uniref:Transposon Ty3-I Gag-Pol polyprotein n=1 Tax=Stichopus japonicus TaxID=307972 RepID=A0A2G8K256_STIJA|nr:Transposon Ty3-I Gag-Pol polyprotein [Apostichopus japonicus]